MKNDATVIYSGEKSCYNKYVAPPNYYNTKSKTVQELRTSVNPAAQRLLTLAAQHAAQHSASVVEPEHLLLAMVGTASATSQALAFVQANPAAVQADLLLLLPAASNSAAAAPCEGPAIERIRHYAWKEAAHLGHRQIDPLHLLLGLLYEDSGHAVELLRRHDVSIYDLRSHVMQQPLALTLPLRPAAWRLVQPSRLFLLLVGLAVGSGAWLFLGPPERFVQALTILFVLAGYVVCLCLHEFGHALAAYVGGDDSVVGKGYLTLDPRHYTHPLLSIVLPLVFLLMGGFGLPGGAVYINRAALRNRRWPSYVSAAGPLATLVCLGLLVAVLLRLVWLGERSELCLLACTGAAGLFTGYRAGLQSATDSDT